MKHLKKGFICLSITFMCLFATAQKVILPKEPDFNKPKLFQQVPDKVAFQVTKLTPLLKPEKGQATDISFSDKFNFKGTVISSVSKYNNAIRSIVVRSADNSGANLVFSQITNPDGSVYYRGRIISFQHGDCFELKTENGQYFFVKKNLNDMVND